MNVSAGALRVQRTPGIGGPGSWEPLDLEAANGYWLLLTEEPFLSPTTLFYILESEASVTASPPLPCPGEEEALTADPSARLQ